MIPSQNADIFASCVSDDFEKPSARFPHFRSALAAYLRRADCNVKVQEDFRQEGSTNTVEKLAGYIRGCQAVLHLLAKAPGAIPDTRDREAFLSKEPNFLQNYPDLRTQLGDCSDLTYTQWEAFLALHYGVDLFVYQTDDTGSTQQIHLDRLTSVHRYPERFSSDVDLLGKLIGDLRRILPNIPELKQQIANSRFLGHSAEDFLGREPELQFLNDVWQRRINVLSLIAWGGVGKTSLIVRWIQQRFIDRDWKDDASPALWRYFDWSFYDQGTDSLDDDNATRTGNVGDFFEEALTFFGDPNPTLPGKGQRLAELVRQQHSLLILDGLEPLQAPPNATNAGQLLDPDLHDLLVALAQLNPGLCLLTSRQAVRDLAGLTGKASEVQNLDELPRETAVRLLQKMQINGTEKELADACQKFGFHALSLTLLGRFLFDAHGGDIARIDLVLRPGELHDADDLTRSDRKRTAWRVLTAYEQWLESPAAKPEHLAVLRLMGLFDRPATADCLQELRSGDVIAGLTDTIHSMKPTQWQVLLQQLERAHLIRLCPSENRPGESDVDAHPLVREYFAEQLRTKSADTFRAAHSRLFDYLSKSTEHQPDTLAGLQPLYQAVTHGCLAGRHQESLYKVFVDRILRGTGSDGHYSSKKLGALGADLGAVASFFEQPWSVLSPNLSEADQAWLLNEAAFRLRALGRLTEAVEPMRVATERVADAENWKQAAAGASNVSELELTLGLVSAAVSDGRRSIEYADLSEDAFQRMSKRTTAADALHQRGSRAESLELFAQAEQMQKERQPQFPLLYSQGGFRYVDLLLSTAERAAWQCRLSLRERTSGLSFAERKASIKACDESIRRAKINLEEHSNLSLLSIALDHLTLARASLYLAILQSEPSELPSDLDLEQNRAEPAASAVGSQDANITQHPDFLNATTELQQALTGLRQAGDIEFVARALLTGAMLRSLQGGSGVEQAFAHLDEAEQIATRSCIPLYLADIHLTRARLAGSLKGEGGTLKVDVSAELTQARRLIEKHNYGRRKEELKDAEAAIGINQ